MFLTLIFLTHLPWSCWQIYPWEFCALNLTDVWAYILQKKSIHKTKANTQETQELCYMWLGPQTKQLKNLVLIDKEGKEIKTSVATHGFYFISILILDLEHHSKYLLEHFHKH